MARLEILDYAAAVADRTRSPADGGVADGEWMFLGDDYGKLKELRGRFRDRLRERDISGEFHAAARELRAPFVEYVSSYGGDHRGSRLCSGFYERVPFQSRVFQDLCYLAAAGKVIGESTAGSLLVVCQDGAVARDLAATLGVNPAHAIRARNEGSDPLPLGRWRLWGIAAHRVIPRATFHALTLGLRHAAARWFLWRNGIPRRDLGGILVHTWASGSTCSAEGYRELYYADLQERLVEKGHPCTLLPHLPLGRHLSPLAYLGCLAALKRSGRPFLAEEYFLGFGAILSAWWRSILNRPAPEVHRIQGISFGGCVYRQDLEDWTGLSIFYPLVVRSLARALKEHGVSPDILVLLHENYSWEKAFLHALRTWHPATTVIGYLHTSVSEFFLMHQLPASSPDLAYLPDIVNTNGPVASQLLAGWNYPKERLVTAGALRYASLAKVGAGPARSNGGEKGTVLVALPIDPDEAAELLEMAHEALAKDPSLTLACKLHPFLPIERLERLVGPEVLGRIRVTTDPLGALLPATAVLVYSTSSSCMDALAVGVPVLKIVSGRRLDIDPVAAYRGQTPYIRAARTADEIASGVRGLIGRRFSPEERDRLRGIMAGFFAPVTDATYDAFAVRKDGARRS
ncbi:MAG TPA: hypothetical protein VLV30_00715 [Methanomicrobiales archaeon]|nr:hypothetical protein [Methanomicrobiales archaeon]